MDDSVSSRRDARRSSSGWSDEDDWWRALDQGAGADHDEAVRRLHALLLRVARAEAFRRSGLNGVSGPELEDLAHQAADDATVSVLRRLGDFRGESRFSTWVYKFAVLEVSSKLGRHVWRRGGIQLDDAGWERLPDRLGTDPDDVAASRELVAAVRRAVEQELTAHQRDVFVAIVVQAVPLDALVAELGSNRNAIYKTLFDARRKLRAHLVTHGYLDIGEGTA